MIQFMSFVQVTEKNETLMKLLNELLKSRNKVVNLDVWKS